MFLRFIILILYLQLCVLSTINTVRPDTKKPSYCVIKNYLYKDDFLYVCNEKEYDNGYRRKVYSNPVSLKYMQNSYQKRWLFIPTDDKKYTNDTFYIITDLYKEFLCSSKDHLEITKHRRKLHTVNMDEIPVGEECIWRLDEFKYKKEHYLIWNLKYNEPLYAANSLFKTARTNRRNVYTWYKNPDSKQFIWFVYCFNEFNKLFPYAKS